MKVISVGWTIVPSAL